MIGSPYAPSAPISSGAGSPLNDAATDDIEGVKLLLARGTDPPARTRIDDVATPLE